METRGDPMERNSSQDGVCVLSPHSPKSPSNHLISPVRWSLDNEFQTSMLLAMAGDVCYAQQCLLLMLLLAYIRSYTHISRILTP